MASAKKEVIRIPHTTYTEKEGVTLTLTQEEARALAAVCMRVGGKPEGLRGIISGKDGSVLDQLESLEIGCDYESLKPILCKLEGHLTFY